MVSTQNQGEFYPSVYPNARRNKPDMGVRCSFCGMSGKNNHNTIEKCPHVSKLRKERGLDMSKWPSSCAYPLCVSPTSHYTAMCDTLHSLCNSCGTRGHNLKDCGRSDLEEIYKKHRKSGMFTKKVNEPLWGFRPPPPRFHTPLLYDGKVYHVDWCPKSIMDFWTRSDGEAPMGAPRSKSQRLGQGILRGFCCDQCSKND